MSAKEGHRMKLPIFAWDEVDGKYAVFPTHLLETFDDGTQGITIWPQHTFGGPHRDLEQRDALRRFSRCFWETKYSRSYPKEHRPLITRRYILKHQKHLCKHQPVPDLEDTLLAGILSLCFGMMLVATSYLIYALGSAIADIIGIG
jgi:hypothetical protein